MHRAVAALAPVLLLAACTSAPPTAGPPPSPSSTRAPDLGKFTRQKLAWTPCGEALDCAHLSVPLDYAAPDGPAIAVGLLRHKATKQRIGSLVVNPGGPGGQGTSTAAALAKTAAAAPLLERFDLVGFDPRGVGTSEPRLNCRSDAEVDADRAADVESDMSPEGVKKQLAETTAYGAKCAEGTKYGKEFLANVGTRDVVRDLDVLRAALGDEKLTYLGYSYGTQIGAAYAEAYPRNVRALLLDGAVDPAQGLVDSLVTQAAGFQDALNEFGRWCACPTAGTTEAFRRLVRPLITKPLPAGTRKLSFEDAITGTFAALYSRGDWPALKAALAQVASGNGRTLLAFADDYYQRDRDGHYSGALDAYFAVRCTDHTRVTDRGTIDRAHEKMLAGAPFLAGGTPDTSELDICSTWPVPPTSTEHTPRPAGLPKPLVISTTHDPATPYQQGVDLAKDLGGTLLTYEGVQHTVFLQGNQCVDRAGVAYLIGGTAAETRC
ncbi:alpha/beta hydrolase fold [Amycolatopsis pretoriensis]|uniref:Alpha/beta hydrolase fold n=1 Tax=Amycolatopsis pretoriensis TaxID=218821 RepID=A0A1H5RF20_9PSEU|nr:alpha/beta hydrolase [Amycolatopsis pretoriensis]SEF36248.1 alpha/beta hydrolase fold [Amycolatopsis pretoriensis]